MRSSELLNLIKAFHKIKRPLLIEGPPGGGKTQVCGQAAKELGVAFIHKHAPTMQPEDFGLPSVKGERLEIVIDGAYPLEGDNSPDHGILLIDELPQADNSIQKTLANLIQEREIYGRKLKSGWQIVATGNRQKDRAGANRILSQLRGRVTTVELETHLDDWLNWGAQLGEVGVSKLRPEVASFIRFKPNLLHDFDPNRDYNPQPRGWVEGVSDVIDLVPKHQEFEVFKGVVGEGAAAEFVAFLNIYRELPDPDKVLADPKSAVIPAKLDILYALTGAIAYRANSDNMDNVMDFVNRLPMEFGTITVLAAIRKPGGGELQRNRKLMQWIAKNNVAFGV